VDYFFREFEGQLQVVLWGTYVNLIKWEGGMDRFSF
jgi:hypothetical protein